MMIINDIIIKVLNYDVINIMEILVDKAGYKGEV